MSTIAFSGSVAHQRGQKCTAHGSRLTAGILAALSLIADSSAASAQQFNNVYQRTDNQPAKSGSAIRTSDGGYASTSNVTTGNCDADQPTFIKYNSSGAVTGSVSYDCDTKFFALREVVGGSGGFIFVGTAQRTSTNGWKPAILRTDSAGSPTWGYILNSKDADGDDSDLAEATDVLRRKRPTDIGQW